MVSQRMVEKRPPHYFIAAVVRVCSVLIMIQMEKGKKKTNREEPTHLMALPAAPHPRLV